MMNDNIKDLLLLEPEFSYHGFSNHAGRTLGGRRLIKRRTAATFIFGTTTNFSASD
jgi:hypothetical protein